MHLGYSTSKYKDSLYKTYYIAESYREKDTGKVKKRILWTIGKLTKEMALQIKLICETISKPGEMLTFLKNVVVKECKPFGEILIAHCLWLDWKMPKLFDLFNTNSPLNTELITRILTINRCVSPCSHYAVPEWISKTAISEIIGVGLEKIDDQKIYYELDKIASNQEYFENHLFYQTYNKDKSSYSNINYDISTSYFYGIKCKLSNYGLSKDGKADHKQVLLGVMVNDRGYPFKWDVYPGNMPEVETLEGNIDVCCKRFKLKNVNIVFDRGFASDDNLTYIQKSGLKFISALDKSQISNVGGIDLTIFEPINQKNWETILVQKKFIKYDSNMYYIELSVSEGRRYILGFNPELKWDEQKCRSSKMKVFENFINEKNRELASAKRSRGLNPTRDSVLNELKRLKIRKYYGDIELQPMEVETINRKGKISKVKSFKVETQPKQEVIKQAGCLDGLCVFVTNHIETKQEAFLYPASSVINSYREKTKIEDAFKHLKSFIEIRPFYVHTDQHVRAVYTISMLAYFINKDLAERREKIGDKDLLNTNSLYKPFDKYYLNTIIDEKNAKIKREPIAFTDPDKKLLEQLGLKKWIDKM
jgi:transposase